MPSLQGLLADRETVEVKWRGETFQLEYAPARITGQALAEWGSVVRGLGGGDEEFIVAYAAFLAGILTGWDVSEDDDGEPLELSAANLGRLPWALLLEIERTVVGGQRPGEAAAPPPGRPTGTS